MIDSIVRYRGRYHAKDRWRRVEANERKKEVKIERLAKSNERVVKNGRVTEALMKPGLDRVLSWTWPAMVEGPASKIGPEGVP